jgi:hypothetical protein
MRAHPTAIGALLLAIAAPCRAAEPGRPGRDAGANAQSARSLLNAAADLAGNQGDEERFWTDRVILRIAELQARADDVDGALRSAASIRDSLSRRSFVARLVDQLARAGRQERAAELVCHLGPDWTTPDRLHDLVRLPRTEGLIVDGRLGPAADAIDCLADPMNRCRGLRLLAAAWARAGDSDWSAALFAQAAEVAAGLRGSDRTAALCELGEAERAAGAAGRARATAARAAAEAGQLSQSSARVAALWGCAALTARLGDLEAARALFASAVRGVPDVDGSIRLNAIELIAIAQAEAGLVADALRTAVGIEHSDDDFTRDSYREHALVAIAVAQLRAGDPEGAVHSALSVKHFTQYRDDALAAVVRHHTAAGDLKAALAVVDKFDNPSRKAAAALRVATALARAGAPLAAAAVADRIELTHRSELRRLLPGGAGDGFDFRRPETWGELYDASDGFTMASHHMAVERAAEVAAAAMGLEQALGRTRSQSYAASFNDINAEEVVRALGQTHAAHGDPLDAIAWARRIGRGGGPGTTNDDRWAVERRINALIGVAEGILEGCPGIPPDARRRSR